MSVYLKEFSTHSEYEAYIASEGKVLPNVSICTTESDVHYNPWVETRVVAKFNVTDTSNPIRIASGTSNIESIEIDGVTQPSVTTGYTFETTGEHIVKYTFINPKKIAGKTFPYCGDNLIEVQIPDIVESIEYYAFFNDYGLTKVTMPKNLLNIGYYAFASCNLESVEIPDGTKSIGDWAFNFCDSLTSVTIPDSVTSIGKCVFEYCSGLTSCTIGSGLTSIGREDFAYCYGLSELTIKEGVETIGQNSFSYCTGLTSINIPDSVTSIEMYAFGNCKSATNLSIGSGVTSIGDGAFRNCSGLTSATITAVNPPTLGTDTFTSTNNCPIYVPSGSVDAYKAASGWSDYASRIQAIIE